VTEHGAFAHDVEQLAHDVETQVMNATNIAIEREVQALNAHENIFSK
jgi:UDP-N-acetylenolpyruvoylglucosamine reductase